MHTHANARSMKIDLMQYAVTAYTQRNLLSFFAVDCKPKLTNQPYYSYIAKYQCLLHKLVLIYTQCYSKIHVQSLESQEEIIYNHLR